MNTDTTVAVVQAQELNFDAQVLALHAACSDDDVESVRALLACDAARDSKHATPVSALVDARGDTDDTPLIIAANCGNTAIVQLLLDAGAAVNATNSSTYTTALLHASQWGHVDVVRVLLERIGATTVDLGVSQIGDSLQKAIEYEHADVARMLLEFAITSNTVAYSPHPGLQGFYCSFNIVELIEESRTNVLFDIDGALLQLAADEGKLEMVRNLVDCHTDMDANTYNTESALTRATREGHIDVVRFLLERGANPDVGYSESPLHVASETGRVDVARVLLAHRADVNRTTNYDGYTPLHCAAEHGDIAIARLLIDHGAAVDHAGTNDGYTPLHMAAMYDQVEVAQLLFASGAVVEIATDEHNMAPLHVAAKHGSVTIAQLLITNGATIDKPGEYGQTPLCVASYHGQLDIMRLLLHSGANVDAPSLLTYAVTPLVAAAKQGHLDAALVLLEHGAAIDQRALDGSSLLDLASSSGSAEFVHFLLTNDADLTLHDLDAPLLTACRWGHVAVVRALLLEGGADIESTRADGKTALLVACEAGRADVVRELLKHHADEANRASGGNTVLHVASDYNRKEVLRVLVRDVSVLYLLDAVNDAGDTALEISQRARQGDFVRMLVDAGASELA